jgi:hypothetical protein
MIDVNIPKYTLISYSRDKNGEPKGVLVAVPTQHKGDFSIGYAQCRKDDRFSKKMGLKIALGRAVFQPSHYSFDNMPHNLRKMLPSFIKRCEKYYQIS